MRDPTIRAFDLQKCQTLGGEDTRVMPGWGCCSCRVYNSLRRVNCKNCGHGRCDVSSPADDIVRPEQIDLTDESLLLSSKDAHPDAHSIGDIIEQAIPFIDAGDMAGASRVLDELFLAGAWANAFKVLKDNHVQYNTFAKDIRGLAVAMYLRGRDGKAPPGRMREFLSQLEPDEE